MSDFDPNSTEIVINMIGLDCSGKTTLTYRWATEVMTRRQKQTQKPPQPGGSGSGSAAGGGGGGSGTGNQFNDVVMTDVPTIGWTTEVGSQWFSVPPSTSFENY